MAFEEHEKDHPSVDNMSAYMRTVNNAAAKKALRCSVCNKAKL